jgi:hypothetical protein
LSKKRKNGLRPGWLPTEAETVLPFAATAIVGDLPCCARAGTNVARNSTQRHAKINFFIEIFLSIMKRGMRLAPVKLLLSMAEVTFGLLDGNQPSS